MGCAAIGVGLNNCKPFSVVELSAEAHYIRVPNTAKVMAKRISLYRQLEHVSVNDNRVHISLSRSPVPSPLCERA